jgi:hypothetical protein
MSAIEVHSATNVDPIDETCTAATAFVFVEPLKHSAIAELAKRQDVLSVEHVGVIISIMYRPGSFAVQDLLSALVNIAHRTPLEYVSVINVAVLTCVLTFAGERLK